MNRTYSASVPSVHSHGRRLLLSFTVLLDRGCACRESVTFSSEECLPRIKLATSFFNHRTVFSIANILGMKNRWIQGACEQLIHWFCHFYSWWVTVMSQTVPAAMVITAAATVWPTVYVRNVLFVFFHIGNGFLSCISWGNSIIWSRTTMQFMETKKHHWQCYKLHFKKKRVDPFHGNKALQVWFRSVIILTIVHAAHLKGNIRGLSRSQNHSDSSLINQIHFILLRD